MYHECSIRAIVEIACMDVVSRFWTDFTFASRSAVILQFHYPYNLEKSEGQITIKTTGNVFVGE